MEERCLVFICFEIEHFFMATPQILYKWMNVEIISSNKIDGKYEPTADKEKGNKDMHSLLGFFIPIVRSFQYKHPGNGDHNTYCEICYDEIRSFRKNEFTEL